MATKPLPHRRSIRLPGFDYSQYGAYYVTICTQCKIHLFGKIADDQMFLNAYGQIANQCLQDIPKHFPGASIFDSIVMPNHVHAVIFLKGDFDKASANYAGKGEGDAGKACLAPTNLMGGVFGKPRPGSVSTIVGSYKAAVTKTINWQFPKLNSVIWQRGFHDHVIRDEKGLATIIEYIRSNPANWEKDEHYIP